MVDIPKDMAADERHEIRIIQLDTAVEKLDDIPYCLDVPGDEIRSAALVRQAEALSNLLAIQNQIRAGLGTDDSIIET